MRPPRGWVVEALVFLAAGALWIAPAWQHPDGFLIWRGSSYSDLAITHWPNADFLRYALTAWHQIPLWNPSILGGAPFAANPLSSLWYPPHWLSVIIAPSLAFNILFAVHLGWAGWGTCRLLRAEGVDAAPSMIGGLIFSGAPKLIGHIGLGHLTLIYAVAWMPWLLLLVRHSVATSHDGGRRMLRSSALAGAVLGLIFLADPRWVIPSAGLASAFGLRALLFEEDLRQKRTRTGLTLLGIGGGSALAISAALAVPLAEFTPLTTRSGLSAADANALALPASRLLGYIIPDLGGSPEWMTYVGVGALFLAMLAIVAMARGAWFWLGTATLSTVLALGNNLPFVWSVIRLIPGTSLLRVPSRFLLISAFSLAILAGLGANSLLRTRPTASVVPRQRIATLGLGALIALLAVGIILVAMRAGNPRLEFSAATAAVSALAFGGWLLIGLSGRIALRSLVVGTVLLLLAELSVVNRFTLDIRTADAVLGEREHLARQAAEMAAGQRIFSPSYSLPQQTAERNRIELADGVDPLQLRSYRDSMARATGFSTAGYSVTLPPFATGDPRDDWGALLDADRLGRWNIGVVVADYPVTANALIEQPSVIGAYAYRNLSVRPRAWVEQADGTWLAASDLTRTPNRIELRATGPGLLVLSENAYPGWVATIDGFASRVESTPDGMRSVVLPSGEHEVQFDFRPWSVYSGAAISLLAALTLAILWLRP